MKIKENYVMREVAGQAIVIAIGEESGRFKGMINLNRTRARRMDMFEKWNGFE